MYQTANDLIRSALCGQHNFAFITPLGIPTNEQNRFSIAKEAIGGVIYLERNEYEIQPAGGYDREGRWYPNHAEHRGCCDMVRKPSAKYWFSLKEHCRSAKHIGELLRLDSRDILKAASRFKEASAIEHSVILRATLLFLLNENLYATVKY